MHRFCCFPTRRKPISVGQIEQDQPFRVQIMSDLHLEVARYNRTPYDFDFTACAPNLALLGDIGLTKDDRLFLFLDVQCSRFDRVFFVLGHHEFYDSAIVGVRYLA